MKKPKTERTLNLSRIEGLTLPKKLSKKIEVLKMLDTFRTMKEAIGDGSYATLLSIADPAWAAKALKGGKRQRETSACAYVMSMALRQAVRLGCKLKYKRKGAKRDKKGA